MIVEFIGASGSGKSTLAQTLEREEDLAGEVVSATALIMERPGRRRIRNQKLMNVVSDLTVLPSFVRSLDRNGEFVRFAFERLSRHALSRFAKYNYMRQVVRNVGKHELAKRTEANARSTAVLVDEGAVLTAYHLFVYTKSPPDRGELERFVRLVPLPDRIVYVQAPLDDLVDRAVRRLDRRRELAMDRLDVERWITRGVALFDALASFPALRDRLLVVANPDGPASDRYSAASRIAAFIEASR